MITTNIIYDHHGGRNKDKPGMIEVQCIINRKVYFIGTGVRVRKENFVGGSVVNQSDAKELNERLRIIYMRVTAELNRAMESGEDIDIGDVRRRAWLAAEDSRPESAPFIEWMEKQIQNMRLREGTMKHYFTLRLRLNEFGVIKRWGDLNVENLYAFDAWLHRLPARQSAKERAAGAATEYISDGSVYNYHKCLKALLNRAVEFGKLDRNPYDRLRGKFKRGDIETVDFLTEEEMEAFEATTPPPGTLMDVAHDLFIFQMYTGLGYSDSQGFDLSQYQLVNGEWVHVGERIKTGVNYVSQLLPPVVEVLEKYDWKVPTIDNSDYNRCLKALGLVAGITRPLHSHMARHTFATYMLNNGSNIHNVSAMLGHTNIRQTQRYAKVLAKSVYRDYGKIARKIKNKNKKK